MGQEQLLGLEGTGTQNTSGTEVGSAPTPISTSRTPTPSSIPSSDGHGNQPPSQASTPSEGPIQIPTQPIPTSDQHPQTTDDATLPAQGVGGNKRKPSRPPSNVWSHYTKEGDRAICKYCGASYAANTTTHGTSNLNKHRKVCKKSPYREEDKKQKTIVLDCAADGGSVTMKAHEFSQQQCRATLAKMIIIDELPFKFIENPGFREFMSVTQPRVKLPSRITLARDVMQLFMEEKVKLKSMLSMNNQMVSLTTDTWTSIQNMNYMCVTAHYIDEGWELHKKILSFALIADHKGETIGKSLEKCMKDWGIMKICTITVDNASANNTALSYLVRGMAHWNGSTLLKGEYMHLRCSAHILNLIVIDGLKELDSSISRIRACVKFLRSSPSRLASFRKATEDANITSNQTPLLDVSTRWNSTYLMLEVAEKFEKAFNRLEYDDSSFVSYLDNEGGPPTCDDWNRARIFIKFLKIFYDATLSFSRSLHVSVNIFFHKMCEIQNTLVEWIDGSDEVLKRMAGSMKSKFDKYWDMNSINYLLLVAVFLDPRWKLEYIEFCCVEMYGQSKATTIVNKLMEIIKKLFSEYMSLNPLPPDTRDNSSGFSSDVASQFVADSADTSTSVNLKDKFRLKVKKKQGELKRNELERYLEEDVEEHYEGFDILRWWRGKTVKYHILCCMARDILAIPVSTVSSESAFSTGGLLDPYHSCLAPTIVEALICSQSWLKPEKKDKGIQMEGEIDLEKVESEISGVSGLEEIEITSAFKFQP